MLNALHSFLDYLSTLPAGSWQVRALQVVLASPFIVLFYAFFIHPRIEDAVINWKIWRKDRKVMKGIGSIDLNGDSLPSEPTAREMVQRINELTVESHRSYKPYEAYGPGEAKQTIHESASNLRERYNLYEGTNHDLDFLFLGYTKVKVVKPFFQMSSLRGTQQSQTEKRRDYMRTIITALILAGLIALFATCPANAATVSATGQVFSHNSTSLKIIEPDGTKVNALEGSNSYVQHEVSIAQVGDTAYGRANCVNGICTWTCLEVIPAQECEDTFIVPISGVVLSKELCAGVLYITLNAFSGGEVRARCEGSEGYAECDALQLNQEVDAYIRGGCEDGAWIQFLE